MKKLFFIFFILNLFSRAQNIYTIAGHETGCQMDKPYGVAVDASGNTYFSDQNGACIWKIDVNGALSIFAGTQGFGGYSGDGGPATSAKLNGPGCIAIDALGNVYVSDGNVIRKINTSGIITTFAGNGVGGNSGDGGPATSAQIYAFGIAIDALGNIYCSSGSNVRKINTSGIISTFAGTSPGYSGDGGPATSAQMYGADGIAFDATGNLYIVDANKYNIRKVNTSGIISTIAGIAGSGGYSGDGGPATAAQLTFPVGIAVDNSNNIYISDYRVIRKINSSGVISTIAGDMNDGYFYGNGVPASTSKLKNPEYMTIDANGNLIFADTDNDRIRMICLNGCLQGIKENPNQNSQIEIYPNPSSSTLHIETENKDLKNSEIEISNSLGQTILKLPYSNTIDVSSLQQGVYCLKIISENNETHYSRFVKE